MGRREDVDNAIWGDPTFEALSVDAKLLYLWSFTNPLCNMAGLYKVSPQRMQRETGLSAARWRRAVDELLEESLLIYERSWLWVRARVKYLRSRNPNMAKSITGDVAKLSPADPLRHRFVDEYGDFSWLSPAIDVLVSDTRSVEPKVGTVTQRSRDGSPTVQGRARAGQSLSTTSEEKQDYSRDLDEWLEHHEQTTGQKPPRPGTKARTDVEDAFRARRREGYELDDLKAATVGAFNDDYRREHGYFGCDSVLRPTKIHNLIERGRAGTRSQHPADRRVAELRTMADRLRSEEAVA